MTINLIKNPSREEIDTYKAFYRAHRDKISLNNYSQKIFDTPRIISTISVKGLIVSGLVIYFKTIVLEDRILLVGAFGDILTVMGFRNKGYASSNISRVMDELARYNIDLAILSADIDLTGNFYGKLGFIPISKPYYYFDKNGEIREGTGGMVAKINNNDSFDYVLNTSENIFLGLSDF